ncbi:MAG: ABC transporter ATP-binding protein [Alphaproteobacteria bacterium]|jgi:putative ABC transport system ATP-binding protein|tara:strand:- start:4003 stop:4668 length:666 start_codon:yes stop_codon:yes gene_type:complete
MNTLLQFSDVHLQYQNGQNLTEVIKGISFTIKQNERLAIVGKSGSGKTSLLMLMAGLEKPTSGSIQFHEEELTLYTEDQLTNFRKKNIGIVFQSFYLIPSYTALENVALSLEINFQKNALVQAEEILTDLGLKDRLHHFPSQLSGGEQQRVAIARAIINKPELILADEPTGNLDEENSQVIADLLFNVSQKYQKSLCLVTHDLELAKKCDRLMKIDNGTII